MEKPRFTGTQTVPIPKQGHASVPPGKAGIRTATYYQWKSKQGGLEAPELKRVKALEAQNARPRRMYAELALDNAA